MTGSPTFLAMAGEPDIVDKAKKGYKAIGRTYKNHIDGFNLLPYLTGKEEKSPRQVFVYISDDGDVLGGPVRQLEARFYGAALPGDLGSVGASRSSRLRIPKMFNLRTDPYEFAETTSNYVLRTGTSTRCYLILYGVSWWSSSQWAATFKDFPPIQKPNTFTIDDAMAKMQRGGRGGRLIACAVRRDASDRAPTSRASRRLSTGGIYAIDRYFSFTWNAHNSSLGAGQEAAGNLGAGSWSVRLYITSACRDEVP